MKDFQMLHRHLKSQVATSEASASAGSRLVGAAAAAFTATGSGRRQRKVLIPSLAQASKTGAIAATKKAITKRGDLLDEYLQYMLSPGHLLSRCSELLLFLGAYHPFPEDIFIGAIPTDRIDPLGRTQLVRSLAKTNLPRASMQGIGRSTSGGNIGNKNSSVSGGSASNSKNQTAVNRDRASAYSQIQLDDSAVDVHAAGGLGEEPPDGTDRLESTNASAIDGAAGNIESIMNKIDQVTLGEVRNRMVELVKYQFGFENASFFRSRMLSALEAASFVAITKASEFRKLLYQTHKKHLNADAIAGWIKFLLDILWPDGVWMVFAPPLTKEQEEQLESQCREKLLRGFPEQLRSILGTELTRDGLEMLHEMLQNRLVMKSLFYMLFDMLWIEIFPELRDVLTCASSLDID